MVTLASQIPSAWSSITSLVSGILPAELEDDSVSEQSLVVQAHDTHNSQVLSELTVVMGRQEG